MRFWTFTLLVGYLLLTRPIQAQWKAVYTDMQPLDTLYSLRHGTMLPTTDGYFFPEYEFYDQSHTNGYILIDKSLSNRQTWASSFRKNSRIRIDTTVLYQRLLVTNVGTYTFYLADSTSGTYYSRTYQPSFDGYQVPLTEAISGWVRLPNAASLPSAFQNRTGNWLGLTTAPANPAVPSRVVVDELVLSDQASNQFSIQHPFFNRLLGQSAYPTDQPIRYHSVCIERGTNEESNKALHSTINLVGPRNLTSELHFFRKLMQTALADYPFYTERHLDRTAAQQAFASLSALYPDTTSYCAFVQATSDWLRQTFGDGHFRIAALPGSCSKPIADKRLRRPVRLYVLNGQAYVMAVLDTTYTRQLPIGGRVLAIDGKPISTLLATHNEPNGYELTTSLDKFPTDSTRFGIADPDGSTRQVLVRYNGRLSLPAQFRPVHADFRLLNGNVAYYRINNWNLDVYLRLLNHWSDIASSRGLIIDLRGNGGGTALSAYRTLSTLINKSAWVYEAASATGQGELIIRPDILHSYPIHNPVVILCDHSTACSSELFMQALRANRPGVQIIGTDTTPGALAQRIDLWFPSGLVLYTDHISPRVEFGKGSSLETKGLQPDEYVRFETLNDLRPFEDKVLRVATERIRQATQPALVEKKD